jgi:hypothetical protein
LIPVARAGRQTPDLDAKDDPDMIQADFGHQALKAGTALCTRSRATQTLVDDQYLIGRPAQLNRPIFRRILQACRCLEALDLLQCRLAHLDHRESLKVRRLDLPGDRARRPAADRREGPTHQTS